MIDESFYLDAARALEPDNATEWAEHRPFRASVESVYRSTRALYREAANADGLVMQHVCGAVDTFDRPPPNGICHRCTHWGAWQQLYRSDTPAAVPVRDGTEEQPRDELANCDSRDCQFVHIHRPGDRPMA
jgi:hypothetical protein